MYDLQAGRAAELSGAETERLLLALLERRVRLRASQVPENVASLTVHSVAFHPGGNFDNHRERSR